MPTRQVEVWETKITSKHSIFGVRNAVWGEFNADLSVQRFKTRLAAQKWVKSKGYQLVDCLGEHYYS